MMRRRRQRTRTTRTSAEMNEPSAVAAPVFAAVQKEQLAEMLDAAAADATT